MYHSIAATAAARFARFVVRPEAFAAQMEHLAAEGYQPVTALDFARMRDVGELSGRPVVLTFDDGFSDFEAAVMPILLAHRFPATLYVPTAYVGRTASWLRDCDEDRRPILSWRALRDVVTAGIEVGSHSHTHAQLDRVPARVVRDEVLRSRDLLEDNLGCPVRGFAYPYGYWHRHVRSSVDAAAYSYACAVGEIAAEAGADIMALPRLTVTGGVSMEGFARLLAGASTRIARSSADMKRWAWRAMRRHIASVGGDPYASDGR